MATQRLAFTKYPALCGLEARHGVNVGTSYRNENVGKTLCHFIAQSRREILWSSLGNETLDDLLMLNTDAVLLSQINLIKALICGGKLPQDVQTNHRERTMQEATAHLVVGQTVLLTVKYSRQKILILLKYFQLTIGTIG